MKKLLVLCLLACLWLPALAVAQSPDPLEESPAETDKLVLRHEYSLGKVLAITGEEPQSGPDGAGVNQTAKIMITRGSEKGQTVEVPGYFSSSERTRLRVGESLIINKTHGLTGDTYYVADKYRLTPVIFITLFFFGFVILLTRRKGVMAIAGLLFSLLVLLRLVVPQILAGTNPFFISLVGSLLIVGISLYLAHGWNRRTTIALLATLITLFISLLLASLFVALAKLNGTGSEEAFYLQLAPTGAIDLRGLLLGGIIIGTLGVLDDITTAQVAAVAEIYRANPKLGFWNLYNRGLVVGREHIISLVNTLVLAYVGASFPLLLLFNLNLKTQPWWVTLNGELIMEEIIRTLVGSLALIMAVPIATYLTTYFIKRRSSESVDDLAVAHHSH